MDGQKLFMFLFGMILIGYVLLYLGGRNYLRESFQDAGANGSSVAQLYPTPIPVAPPIGDPSPQPSRVLMEYTTKDPVAREAVRSLDDYEMNLVYQNESDRELSTALKNKLMSQRPMEWAGLPPSSSQFQAGLRESFQNATPTVPDNAQPFQNIDGGSMVPPNSDEVEMEERKVLQTYKPAKASELGSYSAEEDPEKMIQKLYAVKGLVPTVMHKEGTNVYEIVGVRRKDEKVVYEDEEAPASVAPVQGAGEATIMVPATAYDTAAAKDPFYDTTNGAGKARIGKWDYQAWTPGLERMFAPTNQKQDWY